MTVEPAWADWTFEGFLGAPYSSEFCVSSDWSDLSGTNYCWFDSPQDVAIDSSNNIYVISYHQREVYKLDSTGNLLLEFELSDNPRAIDVDVFGNIYASIGNPANNIVKYDSSGNFISQFYSSNIVDFDVDNAGDVVHVVGEGQWKIYDALPYAPGAGHNLLWNVNPGASPKTVEVDPNTGNVYLGFAEMVKIYNSELTSSNDVDPNLLATHQAPDSFPYGTEILGIGIDGSGNIYVKDSNHDASLVRYDSNWNDQDSYPICNLSPTTTAPFDLSPYTGGDPWDQDNLCNITKFAVTSNGVVYGVAQDGRHSVHILSHTDPAAEAEPEPSADTTPPLESTPTISVSAVVNATSSTGRTLTVSGNDIGAPYEVWFTINKDGIILYPGLIAPWYYANPEYFPMHSGIFKPLSGVGTGEWWQEQYQTEYWQIEIPTDWESGSYDIAWHISPPTSTGDQGSEYWNYPGGGSDTIQVTIPALAGDTTPPTVTIDSLTCCSEFDGHTRYEIGGHAPEGSILFLFGSTGSDDEYLIAKLWGNRAGPAQDPTWYGLDGHFDGLEQHFSEINQNTDHYIKVCTFDGEIETVGGYSNEGLGGVMTPASNAMLEICAVEYFTWEEFRQGHSTITIAPGSSTPGCEETNSCFLPSTHSVALGSTITWENNDTAAHTATSGTPTDGASGHWDSGLIMAGGSYSMGFSDEGTYHYHCMVHPWSLGTVIVGGGTNVVTAGGPTGGLTGEAAMAAALEAAQNNRQVMGQYASETGGTGMSLEVEGVGTAIAVSGYATADPPDDVSVLITAPNGNIVIIEQFDPSDYSPSGYHVAYNLLASLPNSLTFDQDGMYTITANQGPSSLTVEIFISNNSSMDKVAEDNIIPAGSEPLPAPGSEEPFIPGACDSGAVLIDGECVISTTPFFTANPRIVDAFGSPISVVGLGQQVQVAVDVANTLETGQDFFYVLTATPLSSSVPGSESYLTGFMDSGHSMSPALSWTPYSFGDYTLTLQIMSNMENRDLLSTPLTLQPNIPGQEQPVCGAGTVLVNGVCEIAPEPLVCGAGTVLIDGVCEIQQPVETESEVVTESDEITPGSEIQIQTNIVNQQDSSQLFAYIVQIRDESGTPISISTITGSLAQGQTLAQAISWTPNESGVYVAEIFLWDDLQSPNPLSSVETQYFTVTSG